jgi:hypothetical protein
VPAPAKGSRSFTPFGNPQKRNRFCPVPFMRQDKDRCGKWLTGHHGDVILKLAKVTGFVSWRAAQAELVAPRRLPDGLLEVTFPGQKGADPFIIEIETFADRGIALQVFEDNLLTRIERGVVPDVIVLVLRPKGKAQVEHQFDESSRHELTSLAGSFRVIELWKLDADDLFAANDVGMIPWVPLTRFSGPPEQILRQCRERIDRQATPAEHEALLAVTTLLTSVVFDDEALLNIFGGTRAVIESPLLNRILAQKEQQARQADVLHALQIRFKGVPDDLAEKVRAVQDAQYLTDLHEFAIVCPDLEAFRVRMAAD